MISQVWIEWLKGTIPGILVLGTTASVIAYSIISLSRMILRILYHSISNKLFLFNIKPLARAAAMAYRYKKAGDTSRLVIWGTSHAVFASASLLLSLIFLFATIVELAAFQAGYVALSVSLVTVTLLSFVFAIRDILALGGIFAVLFDDDQKEVDSMLKDKESVMTVCEAIFNVERKEKAASSTDHKEKGK